LTVKTAEPIDALSWTFQTQLRQSWEAFQWQLSQWLKSDPNVKNDQQWGWALPVLLWTLRILGLILLAVVIFLLIWQGWHWLTRWSGRASRDRRVEPLEPVRSRLDWLAIAQEAQSRQDYHQAFEALYRALLVQLHESDVLRQDTARTDREYIKGLDQVWSLTDKPLHLRNDWVTLFRTHESLCFGGGVLQQRHFDECRAAYDSLAPYLAVTPGS
jgi:Domain of unknown function (DUF4129)